MELNKINLPPFVVAGLYKKILVEPSSIQSKTEPSPPVKDVKWLGNNEKNILVCVRYPDAVFLPDEQLSFLTTMLSACRLSMQDVAIVNLRNEQSYKEIIQDIKTVHAFLFGVEPLSLGLPVNFPMFQVQPLHKTSFLYAPSLEILEKDDLLKSKLWVCLRRIFSI